LELVAERLRERVTWPDNVENVVPVRCLEVVVLLDEREALIARIAELEGANRAATRLLQTAYREWDEDKDFKIGKRISEVHAVLSRTALKR
jgi:hypothetical protein